MTFAKTIAATSFALLFSSGALAATATSVKNLPNGSPVSLSGTVERFQSEKSFLLRDASGTVEIDLGAAKSMVLKDGEKVDVSGTIDKGIMGTSVAATSIQQDKNIGQQVGDAINSVTGNTPASDAKAATVQSLPNAGLVKVNGTVDDVSSEKEFTLRDATGTITVSLKSGESAALQKGSGVTVVGYVNNGLLSKSIDATDVSVRHQ